MAGVEGTVFWLSIDTMHNFSVVETVSGDFSVRSHEKHVTIVVCLCAGVMDTRPWQK